MNGIHTLSWEQYAAAEGISRSMLETLITGSPLHFYAAHIGGTAAKEETDAMRLGTLTHRCILEPDTMDGAFHVKPEGMNFATTAGKEWKAAHTDRLVITQAEADKVAGMRDAVWRHSVAKNILTGAQTERCFFAEDAEGTIRKARVDIVPRAGNALADLKTCQSGDDIERAKATEKRGYHRQAAFTLAICRLLGLEYRAWVNVWVESNAPYDVVVSQMDDAAVRIGTVENNHALQLYRLCQAENRWPGRYPEMGPATSLPPWRQRELDAA